MAVRDVEGVIVEWQLVRGASLEGDIAEASVASFRLGGADYGGRRVDADDGAGGGEGAEVAGYAAGAAADVEDVGGGCDVRDEVGGLGGGCAGGVGGEGGGGVALGVG